LWGEGCRGGEGNLYGYLVHWNPVAFYTPCVLFTQSQNNLCAFFAVLIRFFPPEIMLACLSVPMVCSYWQTTFWSRGWGL
jgi:hypothetical protein